MRTVFTSKYIRYVSLTAAVVFALPLSLGIWTGIFLWVSPYVLLNSLLSTWAFASFNILGVATFILISLRHRFFCRYLCPTGALCDVASTCRRKHIDAQRFPSIHKYLFYAAIGAALVGAPLLAVLDPVNLFYAFFDAFSSQSFLKSILKASGLVIALAVSLLYPNLWCQRLCPLGGMQDVATELKAALQKLIKGLERERKEGRRYFLVGTAGLASGFAFRKIARLRPAALLRPPGSAPEDRFKTLCIRCGNCSKVCPTQILHPSLDGADLIGALTPHVSFRDSYCLPDCNRCGNVCPSGAISPFSVVEKKGLFIGSAKIYLEDCLLTNFRECDRCKAACEYDAVAIEKDESGLFSIPIIDTDKCVGCGACLIICPAEVISISPMDNTSLLAPQKNV